MPKCPKCEAEIDHLIDWSKEEHKYIFRVKPEGLGFDYEPTGDFIFVDNPDSYECPACGEILFTKEFDAETFLYEGR